MNPPASEADELEAMIRYAMAEHASIRPRGYDTRRARTTLHEFIDDLLDEYAAKGRNLTTIPTP